MINETYFIYNNIKCTLYVAFVQNAWITKLRYAQTKWNELLEQEDEKEKKKNNSPADKRKRNNEDKEHREMDTDSEQESTGTNSESNSNEDNSNVFDDEDMETQHTISDTTELKVDINSNSEHINHELNKRTRPIVPQRKISRLTSAI